MQSVVSSIDPAFCSLIANTLCKTEEPVLLECSFFPTIVDPLSSCLQSAGMGPNYGVHTRTEQIGGELWKDEQSFPCWLYGYLEAEKPVEMRPIIVMFTGV